MQRKLANRKYLIIRIVKVSMEWQPLMGNFLQDHCECAEFTEMM